MQKWGDRGIGLQSYVNRKLELMWLSKNIFCFELTLKKSNSFLKKWVITSFVPSFCLEFIQLRAYVSFHEVLACILYATDSSKGLRRSTNVQYLSAYFFSRQNLFLTLFLCSLTYSVRILAVGEFDDREDCPACDGFLEAIKADPDETWWDWLILLGLFAVFRTMALIVLRKKAEKFY